MIMILTTASVSACLRCRVVALDTFTAANIVSLFSCMLLFVSVCLFCAVCLSPAYNEYLEV